MNSEGSKFPREDLIIIVIINGAEALVGDQEASRIGDGDGKEGRGKEAEAATEEGEGRRAKEVRPAAADEGEVGKRGRGKSREAIEEEVVGKGGDGDGDGDGGGVVEGLWVVVGSGSSTSGKTRNHKARQVATRVISTLYHCCSLITNMGDGGRGGGRRWRRGRR